MNKLEAYVDNVVHHRLTGEFRPNRSLAIIVAQADVAVEYSHSGTRTESGNLLCDLVIGAYCSLDSSL